MNYLHRDYTKKRIYLYEYHNNVSNLCFNCYMRHLSSLSSALCFAELELVQNHILVLYYSIDMLYHNVYMLGLVPYPPLPHNKGRYYSKLPLTYQDYQVLLIIRSNALIALSKFSRSART